MIPLALTGREDGAPEKPDRASRAQRKATPRPKNKLLLFLLPCIYILPPLMESESGVWFSFPISDATSAIVTAILGWHLLVKLGKLKDGDDPDILGSQI